jgi:glycosyltransferase involved in cell wall biosynthesis
MKIAHVTATFLPYYSGTGIVCYYNAVGLAHRGNDVTVFTSEYPCKGYKYPSEITVKHLPAAFRFGNAPFLPDLIRLKGYDIIHLHYPFIFGSELIAINSICRNTPFVLTYHNDLVGKGYRKVLFSLYTVLTSKFVMQSAKKLISVNLQHAMQCQLRTIFARNQSKVIEIPNGVDTDLFRPDRDRVDTRKRLGIPQEARVILFVGVLDQAHHYRGLKYLIDIFSKLPIPSARLVIVGDGDMREEYQNTVKQYHLSKKVIFTGTVPNHLLPSIYRASDVVTITSSSESFGIVAIEAMACGIPVIAHNIPGVGNVISHGEDGLLTPLYDGEQLVEKLIRLLGDDPLREKMGKNGIHKVLNNYAWPAIVEKLEALYREILS